MVMDGKGRGTHSHSLTYLLTPLYPTTTYPSILREESAIFHYEGDRASVAVNHGSIVVFECRSLERVLSAHDVPFDASFDDAQPAEEEAARVAKILGEADDADYWFAASRDGNREGHYRSEWHGCGWADGGGCGGGVGKRALPLKTDFPRPPHPHPSSIPGTHIGTTLVFRHRMRDTAKGAAVPDAPIGLARLQAIIDDFKAKVDAALPGMYAWFDPASRHVTLRGMIG